MGCDVIASSVPRTRCPMALLCPPHTAPRLDGCARELRGDPEEVGRYVAELSAVRGTDPGEEVEFFAERAETVFGTVAHAGVVRELRVPCADVAAAEGVGRMLWVRCVQFVVHDYDWFDLHDYDDVLCSSWATWIWCGPVMFE